MLRQKKWSVLKPENDLTIHISKKFNVSPILARLIINRGLKEDCEIHEFINSTDTSQFLNPFKFRDMNKAVQRIFKAINENEKIAIYGDYDVDGITSTYILYDYISSLSSNVVFYIPDRAEEGYGVNSDAIDKLSGDNVNLIVTVDVGITAVNEVEYAKNMGIDFIITDHHTPKDIIPDAVAVINPKIADDAYPNKNLAGVGVAYKLVYALSSCDKTVMDKYAEAAAIGTIADMVPLIGENRFIASYGIKMLSKTSNPGLKALMDISEIDKSQINSTAISFGIAPRLNAAGRIASAVSSVLLFLENDVENAKSIAQYLDEGNKLRQKEELRILNEAIEIIERDNLYNDNVIVVANSNWHHGVIGIVSSKITEKYYKPSAVISINQDGSAKASGRSITGFNLFDALSACSNQLTKFGGHDLAAGFSLEAEKIDEFRKKINEYSLSVMTEEILIPKITIDSEINSNDLNLKLATDLKILEPHGIGNKQPIFCMNDLTVKSVKLHKSGKHAFVNFKKGRQYFDSPAFNMADAVSGYESGEHICAAGTININSFRGVDNVQFIIKDAHYAQKSLLTVEVLRVIYVYLKSCIDRHMCIFKLKEFNEYLKNNSLCFISEKRLLTSLDIFRELELFDYKLSHGVVTLSKGIKFGEKCDLCQSKIYSDITFYN